MRRVLNKRSLDTIKSDGHCFGRVAAVLGISPYSLPKMIQKNDARLTQADVLQILMETLKVKDTSQLLTDAKILA